MNYKNPKIDLQKVLQQHYGGMRGRQGGGGANRSHHNRRHLVYRLHGDGEGGVAVLEQELMSSAGARLGPVHLPKRLLDKVVDVAQDFSDICSHEPAHHQAAVLAIDRNCLLDV